MLPKSCPPPVSEQEVIDSGILRRAKPGSCVIHGDGALAYKTVIKSKFPKLKRRSVSHRNMEFGKVVKPVRVPSGLSASSSGTQRIDSRWRSLDQTIPAGSTPRKATPSTCSWRSTPGVGSTASTTGWLMGSPPWAHTSERAERHPSNNSRTWDWG